MNCIELSKIFEQNNIPYNAVLVADIDNNFNLMNGVYYSKVKNIVVFNSGEFHNSNRDWHKLAVSKLIEQDIVRYNSKYKTDDFVCIQ